MKCKMCWRDIEAPALIADKLAGSSPMIVEQCEVCAQELYGDRYLGSPEPPVKKRCAHCSNIKDSVADRKLYHWNDEPYQIDLCDDCYIGACRAAEPMLPDFKEPALKQPLTVNEFLRLLKAGLTFTQIVFLRQEGII